MKAPKAEQCHYYHPVIYILGKMLKQIFLLVVSLLISIFLIIPIFSIIFGLNEIRRIFVTIYLILKGSKSKLQNGADGAHGGAPRSIIRVLSVFDKTYNFDSFKKSAIEGVVNLKNGTGEYQYKKFRSVFVKEAGYGCWKLDDAFDPENHFRKLPDEPNMTEERLMEIIQELDQELPKGRPQWEVVFIPQLPNRNESGFIFRIHHRYSDGLAIVNTFVEKLSSDNPFPYVINPVTFQIPFWQKLAFNIKGYAMFGWTFLNGILNPPKVSNDRYPEADETLIHNTRFNLSLTQLKGIQKQSQSTISAILMTALKNALDKLTKEKLGMNSMVIVAKLPYPRGQLTNRITALSVKLPQNDEENWMSQLQAVNKEAYLPNNMSFFVNDTMNSLLGRMPVSVLEKVHKSIRGLLVLSNLPFVTKPINFGDGIMTGCFVWTGLSKSIVVSNMSIGDKMHVSIGAGANILSKEELGLLAHEIQHQLKVMESAC